MMMDRSDIIFITGSCGFIGFFLAKKLLEEGYTVIGMDNMNDYYEVSLKQERLRLLSEFPAFSFVKGDISDKEAVFKVYKDHKPAITVNLAAQAGVRYSIDNPDAYIQSNLVGFANILEACRHFGTKHLVFASSSSVYGGNEKVPFSTTDMVDSPVSLYAATKKSNELMAHSYSVLYKYPVTGLRFFTVYGPMGRPDMAYYKFAKNIMENKPIQVYNNGDMERDFTYVDDIVTGVIKVMAHPPVAGDKKPAYKIYNIGNNKPMKLMDFITTLEQCLSREAVKEFLPMQPGDVYRTYADVSELTRDFGFAPKTTVREGLTAFADWFKEYYGYNEADNSDTLPE